MMVERANSQKVSSNTDHTDTHTHFLDLHTPLPDYRYNCL